MRIYYYSMPWKICLAVLCSLWLAIPASLPAQSATASPKPSTSDKDAVEKDRQRLENLVREERRRLEEEIREKRKAELKARTERLDANRAGRPQDSAKPTTQTAPGAAGQPSALPSEHGPAFKPENAAAPSGGAPTPPPAASAVGVSATKFAPQIILMLKPYNQTAKVGQRFATEVTLYAEKSEIYDRLSLNVNYPQGVIRPLRVFDYPIHPGSDADVPSTRSAKGNSVLNYSTEFSVQQKVMGETTLLYIVWEALQPSSRVQLRLGGNGTDSGLYLGKTNLLDTSILASNATVSAMVQISPENQGGGPLFDTSAKNTVAQKGNGKKNTNSISLNLRKPSEEPEAGEEFSIDVVVNNPEEVAFDDLRLLIGFDPTRARVLDWDYHNWITNGVNIFDGHARRNFPFNVLKRNETNNQSGRIYYHMGSSFARAMPSGTVAKIRVKALRRGAAESFTLFPKDESASLRTDISADKESVLRVATEQDESSTVAVASSER